MSQTTIKYMFVRVVVLWQFTIEEPMSSNAIDVEKWRQGEILKWSK